MLLLTYQEYKYSLSYHRKTHPSMGFNQLFDDIWNLELLQGLKDNLKRTRKRQNASFYSISYFIHSQKQ